MSRCTNPTMPMRLLASTFLLMACAPPAPSAVPGLAGKSRVEVLSYLGPPAHVWAVQLDSPTRFQSPAVAALSPEFTGVAGVTMEELRWEDGDFFVAVFVAKRPGGKWVVVDSFRWHKDIILG